MTNAWILSPVAATAVGASTTSAGAPAYVLNDYAGLGWSSANAVSATITLDLGSDQVVDTVALFGVSAPADATLVVQCATSAQGSAFTAGTYTTSTAIPVYAGANRLPSGFGVSLWSSPAGWPTARYIRLAIPMPSNGIIRIGRAVIGRRVVLARNFTFGGAFGTRDLGSLDFSARGVMLRRRGARLRTAAISFSNAHQDEIESAIQPLIAAGGNTEPLALITNPVADPMIERRSYFGTLVGDLGTTWRTAAAWEWKCNMVSLF
jgi:hypothetical protein